jgi:hypothetical protein
MPIFKKKSIMNKLEQELRTAAEKPKMTAVRFSKTNEAKLVKNFKINRGLLRGMAVIIDRQVKQGMRTPVIAIEAEAKKTAEPKVPKEIKLAKAPVKKKVVAKKKTAPKKAAKKKSKKKS